MVNRSLKIFLVALLVFVAFAESSQALVVGPIGRNGFPAWIGDGLTLDAPGTRMLLCLSPANPELGPCFPTPRFPALVGRPPGAEAMYYTAEMITPTVRVIAAIEAVNGPAEPGIPGGKIILNTVLVRIEAEAVPAAGGVVQVTTPWGTFTGTAPAVGGTRFVEDMGLAIGTRADVPPFSGILPGPIQTFFKAADPALPNPIGFAGGGHDPQVFAGGAFTLTVGGVDVPLGNPAVQGKIFSEPGATAAFAFAAGQRSLVVNCPPTSIDVRGTFGGRAVPGQPVQLAGGTATINLTPPQATRLPALVACTDGAVTPFDVTVANVTDTVTGTARVNPQGRLTVTARSSFRAIGRPARLTVFNNDDPLNPVPMGRIVGVRKLFPASVVAPGNILIKSSAGGQLAIALNPPAPVAAAQ